VGAIIAQEIEVEAEEVELAPDDILKSPQYRSARDDGNKAWGRITRHVKALWDDWKIVGRALIEMRYAAQRLSGTDDVMSGHYQNQFSALLSSTHFADMDKVVRSKLLSLMDNEVLVDVWWNALPFDKQARWTHPTTIWKQFNAKEPRPDAKKKTEDKGEDDDLDDSDELDEALPGGKVKIGTDAAANVAAIVRAVDALLITDAERSKLLKDMAAGLKKAA